MNIEVTQKADGWMLGTIEGGYEWQAKVYEKPSEFGINGGRVSKLFIRPVGLGWQPALISYDRGWDKRPETQDATERGWGLCPAEYPPKGGSCRSFGRAFLSL